MGCEDKDFGNLNVSRSARSVEDHIGDIGAGKRLDSLVDIAGAVLVTVEADAAELGLDQTRFDVGHPHRRVGQIDPQAIGQRLHGSLGGAIDISASVGGISGDTSDVDHMAPGAFHHARNDQARHCEKPLDVGVDHGVPVIRATFIFLFQP